MYSTIELITPELASQWLLLNVHNRPLSKTFVQQLAQQITRGEWQLTHQGIAFDEDGHLSDGQHRLEAIVKAGIPVRSVVTRNVPRSAFVVMDTGRKRGARDALALVGEEHPTFLAPALRGLHLYLASPETAWSGQSSVVSNELLLSLLREHPGIREAVRQGIPMNKAFRITVTAAAVGWYISSRERPEIDQQPWFDGLVTGAGLRIGDPRLTLRNTLLNMAAGKAHRRREDSREHLLYYLKSWNAWVEGREMKLLRRSPGEKMPRISRRTAPPKLQEDG
ncbi:hypothetical protein [Streptoalloteichus hindustanus]|uniref:ParB-like nuclease domain-containing protein n=1 Tax=Streptoalloteichus hindustanus TaxID=2017 RepID=A0A1M5G8A1_STRHI|nr:hypothetical protein [Streptoalloteichus hindustanus]SHF99959.1 hypothetical protein SAMN05444320_10610 [Streptoalloteichus hindustanus]